MELRFTTWQFVRLMVHLEEQRDADWAQRDLLDAWGDVWAELDANLEQLSASDPDGYGALMMDRDVVFENATARQADAARAALEVVMADMDAALRSQTDEDLLKSLKFERRELRQLTRKLARQAQAARDASGAGG